jgi:hypothetical protein
MTKGQMIERLLQNEVISHDQMAAYAALTEAEVREIHDQHLDGGMTETE